MNKIYIILFLLLTFITNAQQVFIGKVINKEDKQPVPYIVVLIEGTSTYQISNEEGTFSFPFEQVQNKNLLIQDSYYTSKQIQILNHNKLEIELEPKVTTLEEIIVSNKSLKDQVNSILEAPVNSIEKKIKLESYYIENIYNKNQLMKTADGLVDFYLFDKKKNYVNTKIKQVRIREKNKDTLANFIGAALKPSDFAEGVISLNRIKKTIKGNNYDHHITANTIGDQNVQTLYFSPKEGVTDDLLYKGKIVYVAQTNQILEISYDLVKEQSNLNLKHKNLLIFKLKVNDFSISAKYNLINNINLITYSRLKFDINVIYAKKDLDFNSESIMYINNVQELPEQKYDKKFFNDKTLVSFGNKHETNFWKLEPYKNWEIQF